MIAMPSKTDILLIGPPKPVIVKGSTHAFNLIKFSDAKDQEKFFAETAPRVRGIAGPPPRSGSTGRS